MGRRDSIYEIDNIEDNQENQVKKSQNSTIIISNTSTIQLPKKPYVIYNFLEKCQDKNFDKNPFVEYKIINNIQIKIARNISIFNLYYFNIPFDKKIKPNFLLQYLKNIDYRNSFSSYLTFKLLTDISPTNWIEEEIYNDSKNIFNCNMFNFKIIFYKKEENFNENTSEVKYYQSYKILSEENNYILRLEMVLNSMDIDQDQDINAQLQMLLNLLRAVYKINHLTFDLDDK
jgi:hypothetical protein